MTGNPITMRAAVVTPDADRPYDDIAVPVDFTSLGWKVLPLAEALSTAFSAPLRLLHVDTSSPWADDDAEQLRLRATPFDRAVDVDVIPDHDVALGIARALTGRRSLVVMGSHGRTGAGELFIDSSTEAILLAVDAPLVIGGPQLRKTDSWQRIVCCLDLDQMPATLLDDVATWAQHLDVGIELLTVLTASTDDEAAVQSRRLAILADRFNEAGYAASAVVLRSSRPGHAIVDYVNEQPGTIAALATHARTAGTRVVFGSVGMKVVRHAHGPVLLRRRDG